jgi:ATP/maltotriose-dependent transcriptional regulator MalT
VIAILDSAVDGPRTVEAALAGYGKITAVAQWSTMFDLPLSWIALGSEGHNTFTSFSLVTSITPPGPDCPGSALEMKPGNRALCAVPWSLSCTAAVVERQISSMVPGS